MSNYREWESTITVKEKTSKAFRCVFLDNEKSSLIIYNQYNNVWPLVSEAGKMYFILNLFLLLVLKKEE